MKSCPKPSSACSPSTELVRKLMSWMERLLILRARHSPNVFMTFCFTDAQGQPLFQSKVHKEVQAFLSEHRYALVELPRDHGKSTQVCGRILWELGRQPALRVKLVCASEAVAAERSRFLRDALMNNRWLRRVFPGLRPSRPWSVVRFTIRRPASVIGESVTALGVNVASTGTRADLLVCDDIVDVRSLRSAAERERVAQFFTNNLMNLLEPDGRFWGLFTPWHRSDLNAELKKNPVYRLLSKPIGENLEPVWPERWPRERLAERLQAIGPSSFARGYKLIAAAAEDATIQAESIKFWTRPEQYKRIVLAVDPAVSPNPRADASALVVLGETESGQIHCLQALARKVKMPILVRLIEEARHVWRPQRILFEAVAGFKGISQILEMQEPFHGLIRDVQPSGKKEARVEIFGLHVNAGKFLLKGMDETTVDPAQQELFDQMISFPAGDHDDLVDAAAMGTAWLIANPEPRVW
jgi:predicted phage terminase large subunit-like protein